MIYMGSKRRIAPFISDYINSIAFNKNIENYYEPFVGGGNMIHHINIKNRYGSDLNKYMIALFHKMQEVDTLEFIDIDKETYFDIKHNPNKYDDWFVGYASIVHTYRKGGVFNYYENFKKKRLEHYNNILNEIPLYKNIHFTNCSYEQVEIKSDSIVYCDAPYINTTKYNTGTFDFNRYYKWLLEVAKNNLVFISEYTMPEEHFKCIDSFKIDGALSRKNNNTKRVLKKTECIENLYIVKGGYLTEEYFGDDIITDF